MALAAPFVPVARPGTKGGPGVPGWETGTKKGFLTGTTLMFYSSGLDEVAVHAGVEKGERHGRAQEDTSAGAVPVRTEPAAGLRRLLCP